MCVLNMLVTDCREMTCWVVGGWYENEAVQEVKWAIDSLAKTGG